MQGSDILQPDGLGQLAKGGYQLCVYCFDRDMQDVGSFLIGETLFFYELEDQLAPVGKRVDGFFHFFPHLRADANLFGVFAGEGDLHRDGIQGGGGPALLMFEQVEAPVAGNDEEPDPDIFDLHQPVAVFPEGEHGVRGHFFRQFDGPEEVMGKFLKWGEENIE